jgi:hypothetical protein
MEGRDYDLHVLYVQNNMSVIGPDPRLTGAQPSMPKTLPVKFVHREGKAFHAVPADGVWGLLNAQGAIQMNFFTEHPLIPDSVTFPINSDGSFGVATEEYKEKDEKNFVVIREFQVNVTVSLASAKQIHNIIGNFIALAEDQIRMAEQMKQATLRKV